MNCFFHTFQSKNSKNEIFTNFKKSKFSFVKDGRVSRTYTDSSSGNIAYILTWDTIKDFGKNVEITGN